MLKTLIFTLAALVVVLMSNVYVGRAEEEPFGNITKMWEIPAPWGSNSHTGEILIDTNRNYWLMKVSDSVLKVFNLNDGTQRLMLSKSKGIRTYQFIENKSKLVIFSDEISFYDCDNFNLISQIPYPESMYFLTLFSDDGTFLLGAKLIANVSPYLYIYNFTNMQLQDSIHLEEGFKFGRQTMLPSIKISTDNSKIFTKTSYMKWQILPEATVYFVYDTKTKDTILRQAWESYTIDVISNDWKYLYVAESKFNQQKNETEITLNEISTDGFDKEIQKFIDENFDELFISDNNKFLIYQPNPIKFRYLNLIEKKLKIEPNLFPDINIYRLQKIKDGYLFLTSINGLSCYNINNSILSNIANYDSSSLNLFPNPTTNAVRIREIDLQNKIFKFTDSHGADISLSERLTIFPNEILINLNGLSKGTYFFNISDKASSKTYKILKI